MLDGQGRRTVTSSVPRWGVSRRTIMASIPAVAAAVMMTAAPAHAGTTPTLECAADLVVS